MTKCTSKFLGNPAAAHGAKAALAIIALAAIIAFSTISCEEPEDPVILKWASGNLTEEAGEAWHSINVVSGTTYSVWVKEYWSMSVAVADKYADVKLDARYGSQTGTVIFEKSELGNLSTTTSTTGSTTLGPPTNFKANQNGTVYIRVYVEPGLLATYGNYKVAVSTDGKRPSGE